MKDEPILVHGGDGIERRIFWLTLLAASGGAVLSLYFLWTGDLPTRARWTGTAVVVGSWWLGYLLLHERVTRSLGTLANMVGSMREGDFSLRVRRPRREDALGDLIIEANELSESLRQERLGAVEASRLLQNVLAEVDVAILAFDEDGRLMLVNRAGEALCGATAEHLTGRSAAELGLADCLDGERVRTIERAFAGGGSSRWGVRRSTFRERGRPHSLLVLSNLSQTLREEERSAWRRLIRVLAHELNNSLAPIKSIAESLRDRVRKLPDRPESEELGHGLGIVCDRAASLTRFMAAYSRLARLPAPTLGPVAIGPLLATVVGLETRLPIELVAGPEVTLDADRDQLQQVLVNLLKNAVDATLETRGNCVRIGWTSQADRVEVWIEDDGPGISNPENLFVPFFTTKPGGTGVGLVLSRQIAEAHAGELTLEPRDGADGCVARLRLPAAQQ